jgi:predicted  nucleic acid-binding Zn-ribbon protein
LPSQPPPLTAHPPHPALVLGVYGEDLAHGARTAVFGNATLGLAEELVLRGARLVHVYDVDAARVAEANARSHHRSIFYAPLPEGGDIGVRDGAFEFVVVPDLSIFADPAAIMALVRRVVSPLGAALIASPNADAKAPLLRVSSAENALGYYELYEAIATHFTSVRMIGQAPFVGYAVAELSVEDPEPTIDSSLAESEGKEPDWFLALASDRNVRLDPFALIELPVQVFSAAVAANADALVPALAEDAPRSGAGTVLINILEAEREAALESLRQQEQALQGERFRADRVAQELAAAREEVDLLRERCRTFDERINDEEARRSSLETKLEKSRNDPEVGALRERLRGFEDRARGAEDRVRGAEEKLRGSEDRVRGAEEKLRGSEDRVRGAEEKLRGSEDRARGAEEKLRGLEERARIAEEKLRSAEQRAHAADEKIRQADEKVRAMEERARGADERVRAADERAKSAEVALQATVGEHEGDISKLEAQLRERGHEIQALRDEIDRRDKLVRELVMTNFPPPGVTISNGAVTTAENGSGEASNGPRADHPRIEAQEPTRVADLSARLDRMANDAARREADLVGARWRIAQLERELTQQR